MKYTLNLAAFLTALWLCCSCETEEGRADVMTPVDGFQEAAAGDVPFADGDEEGNSCEYVINGPDAVVAPGRINLELVGSGCGSGIPDVTWSIKFPLMAPTLVDYANNDMQVAFDAVLLGNHHVSARIESTSPPTIVSKTVSARYSSNMRFEMAWIPLLGAADTCTPSIHVAVGGDFPLLGASGALEPFGTSSDFSKENQSPDWTQCSYDESRRRFYDYPGYHIQALDSPGIALCMVAFGVHVENCPGPGVMVTARYDEFQGEVLELSRTLHDDELWYISSMLTTMPSGGMGKMDEVYPHGLGPSE